jgi:hypothetical protein
MFDRCFMLSTYLQMLQATRRLFMLKRRLQQTLPQIEYNLSDSLLLCLG